MPTERRVRYEPADTDLRARPSDVAAVDELGARFATFHSKNPPHTRIPNDLRAAVIAAMRRGVTAARLRHACGLSTSQLARWRALLRGPSCSALKSEQPRVFSVVGEVPPRPLESSSLPPAHDLELRLGPWSVSVRLAALPEPRQGCLPCSR